MASQAAIAIGGNGLISALAAGFGFGAVVRGRCKIVCEFTESEGQLLSRSAFLLLGAVLMPDAVRDVSPQMVAVILVSLFVVRPAAIWLSLLRNGAALETKLLFGWFGPRGLAMALFAPLVADQLDGETGTFVLRLATNAVWISALLHGLTAAPGARWYAVRLRKTGAAAEMELASIQGRFSTTAQGDERTTLPCSVGALVPNIAQTCSSLSVGHLAELSARPVCRHKRTSPT